MNTFFFITPNDRSVSSVAFLPSHPHLDESKFLYGSKTINMHHIGCFQSIQFQGLSFHLFLVSVQITRELCAASKSPSPPDVETSPPGPNAFSSHPMVFILETKEIVLLWQFCCCTSGENFTSAEINRVLVSLEL